MHILRLYPLGENKKKSEDKSGILSVLFTKHKCIKILAANNSVTRCEEMRQI